MNISLTLSRVCWSNYLDKRQGTLFLGEGILAGEQNQMPLNLDP